MKRSKIPAQLAKNASKLHKRVGELLVSEDSPYKNYEIRQEYRVSDVNPDYASNREKFDWVILNLKVVIEIHGEQHYAPVCFGGMDPEQAAENFRRRKQLDTQKQEAAEKALWAYVIVSYKEKDIDIEELHNKITEALRDVPRGQYIQKKQKVKIPTRKEYKWPTRKIPSRKFNSNK
jgi:very-short-patch-repair endonuclease